MPHTGRVDWLIWCRDSPEFPLWYQLTRLLFPSSLMSVCMMYVIPRGHWTVDYALPLFPPLLHQGAGHFAAPMSLKGALEGFALWLRSSSKGKWRWRIETVSCPLVILVIHIAPHFDFSSLISEARSKSTKNKGAWHPHIRTVKLHFTSAQTQTGELWVGAPLI